MLKNGQMNIFAASFVSFAVQGPALNFRRKQQLGFTCGKNGVVI
jgi:hypothetical protein